VGSRLSIAAGVLPTEPDALHRWIAHTEDVKPGVLMPEFGMLPQEDLSAMAAYLDALQ
jgi:cytochrome c oxidase subunit 2